MPATADQVDAHLRIAGVILLPQAEAAENESRAQTFFDEFHSPGKLGEVLVRMSVRMERCSKADQLAIEAHVGEALEALIVPEGVTEPAQIAQLRKQVESQAMVESCPDAQRARKDEQAAERSFLKALKELRLRKKQAREVRKAEVAQQLASISTRGMTDEEFDTLLVKHGMTPIGPAPAEPKPRKVGQPGNRVDLSIGVKPRC